jgi:HSP20 family protein
VELKLWSPFFDMEREWRFDFPRLFGESVFGFRPTLDVVKGEGELVVTAELPGIDPDEVEVALDGNFLMIKGEKSEEKEVSEDDRYVHERAYGKFQRRLPLPEGVSADKIAANYDKGVLTIKVTLPEAKAIEPRTIPVEKV